MTVKQFQDLGEVGQLKILIQYGILIGEITEQHTRVFMYQVQDFFVETRYTLKTDELTSIESFNAMDQENRSRWTILNLTTFNSEKYRD